MAKERAIAIDAGQTGIRVRLDDGGTTTEFDFPGIRTDVPLIPQLEAVVGDVLERSPGPVDSVGAGISGLTTEEATPAELLAALASRSVASVHLAHDSITSYLGALGDERGAVIAVGTGVVTLAVGAEHVSRVDGWGYLMGDAGSGYWIGRRALDVAMRGHDGRGPTTLLTDAMRREFPDIESAYIELQGDPGRVRRIASYSRWVTELADEDAVAARVCDEAADELVLSVVTSLRRVGETEAPLVCGIGGVLSAPAIAARFTAQLHEAMPSVELRSAVGTGLDGAALLAHLHEGSAVRELVHVARV